MPDNPVIPPSKQEIAAQALQRSFARSRDIYVFIAGGLFAVAVKLVLG